LINPGAEQRDLVRAQRKGIWGGPRRLTGVPFAYVRLLGDREAVGALTPTLGHIVIDCTGQVAKDARAIRVLRQWRARGRVREQPLRRLRPRDGAAARGTDRRHRRTTRAVITRSVPSGGPMVRVMLGQAVDDGLVDATFSQWGDPDLRARTAEELAGMADTLARYLRDGPKHRRGIACQPPGAVLGGSAARSVPAAHALRQRLFAVAAAGHPPRS